MTIGANILLMEYGSRLKVAEALLKGKLEPNEQKFVSELVTPILLEAARIRLKKY